MTNSKSKRKNLILAWLDVLAITTWGVVMLKYWLTNKLNLLIHSNYFPLVIAGGVALIIIGVFKAWELVKRRRVVTADLQHISLFPPGIGSTLLLITAIISLMITPQVFASQKALDRGVTDFLGSTRVHPKAFRAAINPEQRSLLEWVRTLNTYPEPDKYKGQKARVRGFAIHPKEMSEEYLVISQFVITCCAADAYPIGLPVKLQEKRSAYPPDGWLEIEGKMVTENLAGKRQLTIAASSIKKIPVPANPYED